MAGWAQAIIWKGGLGVETVDAKELQHAGAVKASLCAFVGWYSSKLKHHPQQMSCACNNIIINEACGRLLWSICDHSQH
ncbi:MAG UNVERIFIED_CONTAM: hypothetical protein LVT10_01855 [Anaerolineae bacterium]